MLAIAAHFKDHLIVIFRRKQRNEDRHIVQNNDDNEKKISYLKLEERRVLNATFAFDLVAAELTLEDFTDSGAGDNFVDISQSGNDYVFTLGDGIWSSSPTSTALDGFNFTLGNNGQSLSITNGVASISSLLLIDNTTDTFDIQFNQFDLSHGSISISGTDGTFGSVAESSQTSSALSVDYLHFEVDSFDLSNGQHDIVSVYGTAIGDLTINDSNGLQIEFLQTYLGSVSVVAQGDVELGPAGFGIFDLAGGGISVSAEGENSDLLINNFVLSDHGDITLHAADQIVVSNNSLIFALGDGKIEIVANQEGGDDQGQIVLEDGSWVDSDLGETLIANTGTGNGDIHLSHVFSFSSSDSAIEINSVGSILDASLNPSINIDAEFGGVQLQASEDIGSDVSGQLSLYTHSLAFDTSRRNFRQQFE